MTVLAPGCLQQAWCRRYFTALPGQQEMGTLVQGPSGSLRTTPWNQEEGSGNKPGAERCQCSPTHRTRAERSLEEAPSPQTEGPGCREEESTRHPLWGGDGDPSLALGHVDPGPRPQSTECKP